MMLRLICAALMVGCSSEPIGHSSESQTNTCFTTYKMADTVNCDTIYCYQCENGDKGCGSTPALGSTYVGQWCLVENGQTYYYVCGANSQNEAWVYCNNSGQ